MPVHRILLYYIVWCKMLKKDDSPLPAQSYCQFQTVSHYNSTGETFNRWRTVVSATWKYDDPRLNMSHEGAARVWHVQPRVIKFPCRTNYRVSYVLSSDQLQESWIICKLKSFSPMYLHDYTQDRRVIFRVSKTLCDFGHKKSFTEE